MRAGNSTSKPSHQTDTAPEGKGEQRELRVERQTHLPASREEAWQALQSLLPGHAWKETSAVFASLEAIYKYATATSLMFVNKAVPVMLDYKYPVIAKAS